jgi:hypothetical protein
MDVVFNEDRSTIRKKFGSENFSLIRKFCLNLLKKDSSSSNSINRKRLKCCWDRDYLLRVLYGDGPQI